MNKSPQSNFSLFAANNTKIPAYGKKEDSKPLNWSSEAITAFQRCKQALADAALLAHPSPSAPLALHVDASDYAIGGALHQNLPNVLTTCSSDLIDLYLHQMATPYCLTMIDRFSKWPEAQPLKDIIIDEAGGLLSSLGCLALELLQFSQPTGAGSLSPRSSKLFRKPLGVQKCRTI
ncbi:hypothetical protein TNCV_2924961 [Trichonephila clavipes]|nr:hypothetical protein TNCV_2924961 [Trichonephila clavipes]